MTQIVIALFALLTTCSAHADSKSFELMAIGMAESSNGIYKNHSVVTKGLNAGTHAGGSYGLMGLTVKDLIRKFPSLKKKYSRLLELSPNQISNWISAHPADDKAIATVNWTRLRKHMTFAQSAYSWLNGEAGCSRKTQEQIRNNPYVKKVLNNYELLRSQVAQQ